MIFDFSKDYSVISSTYKLISNQHGIFIAEGTAKTCSISTVGSSKYLIVIYIF